MGAILLGQHLPTRCSTVAVKDSVTPSLTFEYVATDTERAAAAGAARLCRRRETFDQTISYIPAENRTGLQEGVVHFFVCDVFEFSSSSQTFSAYFFSAPNKPPEESTEEHTEHVSLVCHATALLHLKDSRFPVQQTAASPSIPQEQTKASSESTTDCTAAWRALGIGTTNRESRVLQGAKHPLERSPEINIEEITALGRKQRLGMSCTCPRRTPWRKLWWRRPRSLPLLDLST